MIFLTAVTAVMLALIVAPILMVVIVSFSSAGTLQFPPPGWTLNAYRALLDLLGKGGSTERVGESLLTSLGIASVAMVTGVIVGVLAAYALDRFRFTGKSFVEQLVSLPLVFPVVVLGISFLVMVSNLGINLGFWRIVVGHVIITFPFAVRNCMASLRGINPAFEEAAWTLGAGRARAFWEIVLPLMRSSILASMLLVFILSFNEFTVSYFLYTVDLLPFPIWLFSRAFNVLDPTVFALASVIVAINLIFLMALDRLIGKQGVWV